MKFKAAILSCKSLQFEVEIYTWICELTTAGLIQSKQLNKMFYYFVALYLCLKMIRLSIKQMMIIFQWISNQNVFEPYRIDKCINEQQLLRWKLYHKSKFYEYDYALY